MKASEVLTFTSLDWPQLERYRDSILNAVAQVPDECWYADTFRNCSMLPLYSPGGHLRALDIMNSREPLAWTEPALQIKNLPTVLELLQPIFKPMGRLFVLRSLPGAEITPHIDCSPEKKDADHPDLKFRWVLSGPTNSLYFLNAEGAKIFPNSAGSSLYMIDGKHPHGTQHASPEVKYTFCLGAPWLSSNQEFFNWFDKHKISGIKISSPVSLPEWFHPRYGLER